MAIAKKTKQDKPEQKETEVEQTQAQKIASKGEEQVVVEVHSEYDPSIPENKQRHLR